MLVVVDVVVVVNNIKTVCPTVFPPLIIKPYAPACASRLRVPVGSVAEVIAADVRWRRRRRRPAGRLLGAVAGRLLGAAAERGWCARWLGAVAAFREIRY